MLMRQIGYAYNHLFAHGSMMNVVAVSILAGVIAVLPPSSATAQTRPAATMDFDIPAQPVSSALRAYAHQAKVQLLVLTEGLEAIRANTVVGSYNPSDALLVLLEGTGLHAEHGIDSTVMIRRKQLASQPVDALSPGRPFLPVNESAERMAVADTATSEVPDNHNSQQEAMYPENLEEILVTGTQIRGAAPVGTNVVTLDREHIDATGLATTQEILQSVPQNFGGGPNEATSTVGLGFDANLNAGYGSSVNLRGLGTDSTLVLLNGRRSAPGGGGDFVDLNSIPAAAIERVEVLLDGASAIYGSDAVGGVINVILRDDYDGAETRIRYAPGTSDITETQFNHLFGKQWNSGHLLFTYEYHDRSALESADRSYTRNSDLRSLGGTDHSLSFSNPGNITSYTSADGTVRSVELAIPENQDGGDLSVSELITGLTHLQNIREGTRVLPAQERNSALILLSQQLSPTVQVFADGRYSSRKFEHRQTLFHTTTLTVPSSNPFFVDPFGDSTQMTMRYSYVDDYGPPRLSGRVDTIGATGGAVLSASDSWEVKAHASYSLEEIDSRSDRTANTALLALALADNNPETAFNPFGDGSHTSATTIAAIEGFETDEITSRLNVFNILASGDLFEIPGGTVKLAIGGQLRSQSTESESLDFTSTLSPVPSTSDFDLERDVSAVFAELHLPLVTEANERRGIEEVAVSLAARYEDYSDFGGTFDPKVGVSWSPLDGVVLKSTFGSSFRAPLLRELDDSGNRRTVRFFIPVPDPASPTGTANALFLIGNNPNLLPEQGSTFTAGLDLTPTTLPGFSVGLTYFSTKIDNVIQLPTTNLFQPLLEPSNFGPIIRRVPDDADLATVTALLNEPRCFCGSLTSDEVDAIVDIRLSNLLERKVAGLDFNLGYAFDSAFGSFDLGISASHLLYFKEQTFANSEFNDIVDTLTEPNSLKLRGHLTWNSGGISASLFGNYIGDYTDTTGDEVRPVSSWATWDLNIGYDFSERYDGFLEDMKVSANTRNIFNADPPFVDVSFAGVGFDAINANPLGRFLSLQVTKEW